MAKGPFSPIAATIVALRVLQQFAEKLRKMFHANEGLRA